MNCVNDRNFTPDRINVQYFCNKFTEIGSLTANEHKNTIHFYDIRHRFS